MLDASFGDRSDVPTYIGKDYKWIYDIESNIAESQFMKTFDSEIANVKAGVDDIK